MFKTVSELKEFIIWSKSHKVKRIKVDNIEIELSELAFIVQEENSQINNSNSIQTDVSSNTNEEDEDELLYASSTGQFIG